MRTRSDAALRAARWSFAAFIALCVGCNQANNPVDPYAGGTQHPWADEPVTLSNITLQTGYLSDQSWVAATNGWGSIERDKSNGEQAAGDGRTLSIGGKTYAKGLGVHANSRVQYDLSGNCQRFLAEVGVDDEVPASASASVRFEIWSDGQNLYNSGRMTRTSGAKTVNIDLSGRGDLVLFVYDENDGINWDHADWANARLECGSAPPPSGASLVFLNVFDGQTLSGSVRAPGVNVLNGTASGARVEFRRADGTFLWENSLPSTPICVIGICNWWETNKLTDGDYVMKASVTLSSGGSLTGQVGFRIQNGSPPPPPPAPPAPPPPPPPGPPPPPPPPPPGGYTLGTQQVASGFSQPVYVTHAPGGAAGELYVVEQGGTVKLVTGSSVRAQPFLNLEGVNDGFSSGGERGLLSIAFHPQYASNGYVFVFYTRNDGDLLITRFTADRAAKTVDLGSRAVLLTIEHSSAGNHNGGQLQFGADGLLYISTGDGGSNPQTAQDTYNLLGKLLRIGVNDNGTYFIPDGNPFKNGGGAPEVFTYGLRNPWRFSFDRGTRDLWIGDVGEGRFEEINFRAAGTAAGVNFGWNTMEGPECFGGSSCDTSGKVLPVFSYAHNGGSRSVTGGYVYRGSEFPALVGRYFLADFIIGTIWSLTPNGAGGFASKQEITGFGNPSGFGEGPNGELYILRYNDGTLHKIVAR